jgi:hypothetical protein
MERQWCAMLGERLYRTWFATRDVQKDGCTVSISIQRKFPVAVSIKNSVAFRPKIHYGPTGNRRFLWNGRRADRAPIILRKGSIRKHTDSEENWEDQKDIVYSWFIHR